MGKIKSITILGSSSGRNAGDAALLSGIMDTIDGACERRVLYEIPTYRPNYIWHNYENKVRPVSMLPYAGTVGMLGLPTLSSVRRSNLTLIYDAMLFDRKLWNPLTNYMSTAWLFLKHLKKQGNLVGFYNVGAGPVDTDWGKKMLFELGDLADFITVRDQDSYNLLQELGVNQDKMTITADAAITVEPSSQARVQEIFNELGLDLGSEILAININSYLNSWTKWKDDGQAQLSADHFLDIYAEGLNGFLKEHQVPVLFVCTQHSDIPVTQGLMRRVKGATRTALFTNQKFNHYDVKGVLKNVSLLFAMRLHANILATSAGTPSLALLFQKKVESYYNGIGLPENTLSFNDFTADKIKNHLLYGWENRAKIRAKLSETIPVVAENAKTAGNVISAIDRGEDFRAVIREMRATRGL